jgi:hypothetical protein
MKPFFLSVPGAIATLGLLGLWFLAFQLHGADYAAIAEGGGRAVMQIAISFIVLGASLYAVLSKKYDADVQKWAYGAIGTVMGYWLPGV